MSEDIKDESMIRGILPIKKDRKDDFLSVKDPLYNIMPITVKKTLDSNIINIIKQQILILCPNRNQKKFVKNPSNFNYIGKCIARTISWINKNYLLSAYIIITYTKISHKFAIKIYVNKLNNLTLEVLDQDKNVKTREIYENLTPFYLNSDLMKYLSKNILIFHYFLRRLIFIRLKLQLHCLNLL